MLAVDLAAPPSLSVAFADYRAHQTLALVDADGFDPRVDSVDEDPPVVGGADAWDAERIQRRHRLGKAGVVTMLAGVGATTVGAVVLFGSALVALGGEPAAAGAVTGAVLVIGGGVATLTGEVMLFTGGIGAARLLGESTTVGWVGVGLVAGALVLNGVSLGTGVEEISLLAPGMSIAGLVCGAVQLGQAGRAGREAGVISLMIAPSPNGVRVGGMF